MDMYSRPMPPDLFRQTDPRLADHDPPEPPGLTWPEAFNVLIKVRDTLSWIIARFWSPAAFGALTRIMRSQRRELLAWLRPLETILRRLFLIEAHALAATLAAPTPREAPQAPHIAKRNTRAITNDPSTWTAPFSILATATAPSTSRDDGPPLIHSHGIIFRTRPQDEDRVAARPLALRIEAVLRAVIDPMPCIRRLARQLRLAGSAAFASQLAQQACEIPSLKRTFALVTDAGAPLFSPHSDSS